MPCDIPAFVLRGTLNAVISAAIALLLVGCDTTLTGYDYDISAVYRAPKSGLVVEVHTNGHVPAGADTADSGRGEVRIRPEAGTADLIVMTIRDDREWTYRIGSGSPQVGIWRIRERESTLTGLLADAGYETRDAAEIEEIVRAISGALGGPKSIMLKGQSNAIEVLTTHFE